MIRVDPAVEAARALARFVPRLARNIAVALEEEPSLQLSLRQLRILERLAVRPHRPSELAVQSMVSQPTATTAIAPLEARGIVRRSPDPLDRRATLIELTDAGRALLDVSAERIQRRLLLIVGEVTDVEADEIVRLEQSLVAGMDEARAQRVEARAVSSKPAASAGGPG